MMIKVNEIQRRQLLKVMGVDVYSRRENSNDSTNDRPVKTSQLLLDQPGAKNRNIALKSLAQTVADCQRCQLHQTRTQTVFGSGTPDARVMLVGEAPGENEDQQGAPFVGRAGQLLDLMLAALGWRRDDVYLANILKCRPPDNRNPQADEISQCESYLIEQIEIIKPQLLVALGRFAAQSLLQTTDSIASLRGCVHTYGKTNIPLIVTYHPAYLLRNPIDKEKSWQDLLKIRAAISLK